MTVKTARSERSALVFLAVLFALWSLGFVYLSSFVASDGQRYFSLFDDAMISMRYAWNLSHGYGLVWNVGEPVEGYTNLLMVLWMTPWTWLLDKPGAVLAVQLGGIPTLLGVAALARLCWLELARGGEVQNAPAFGALAFLGSLLYYPLAYWTLMGMETGLLTLLLLAGSLLSLIYMRTASSRALNGSAVAFSLAYLSRPDSAPVALVTLFVAAVLGPSTSGGRIRTLARVIGIFAVLPLLQVLFRALYYKSLVPVTYTLKATGMPFDIRLQNGWGFTAPFIREAGWVLAVAALGAIWRPARRLALVVLPPVVLIAYQVAIGGDAWPYWRMVAPAMPYLVLLALAALDTGFESLKTIGGGRPFLREVRALGDLFQHHTRGIFREPTAACVAVVGTMLLAAGMLYDVAMHGSPGVGSAQRILILGGILAIFSAMLLPSQPARLLGVFMAFGLLLADANARFLMQVVLFDPIFLVRANLDHVNMAISVNQYTREDASIGVVWAGIIPYYTSRYAIDFLGKNDPYIASLPADVTGAVSWEGMSSVPGHNKYDLEHSIVERQPTYVESFDWGSQDFHFVFKESYISVAVSGPDPAFRRGDPAVRWDLIPPEKIIFP